MGEIDTEKEMDSFLGACREEAQAEDATVPWVLNQVLLPLILVLTFVALLKVVDYKQAWTDIVETTRSARPELEREVLTMNLQLVKLLSALQQVEYEQTSRLKLAMFESNAGRIQRRGAELHDADFQFLCARASQLFKSGGYSEASATIYSRCLEIAGVQDGASGRDVIRRAPVEPIDLSGAALADLDNRDYADVLQADAARISARNRRILHNAILDFLDGLGERVKAVQEDLIALIARDMTRDPASFRLPAKADALLKQMALEDDAESVRRLEADFYASVIDAWRGEFLAGGYDLLVWDELKVL